MIKGIIFDMDGVLFDSEPLHHKAWYKILEKYGIQSNLEEMKKFTGISADIIPKYFREKTGKNIPDDSVNEKQEILNLLAQKELVIMPYVKEYILKLRKKELPIALASSSIHKLIDICLETSDMKKYFNVICSGQDIENGKPAPDIFICAAQKLGIPPSECLVIEDSISGVEGAKKAGCTVWGYTSSFDKNTLIKAGADKIFESFKELI